jgi:2-keto-4-pentenoate hydratase/2-oxohepta-3-ene-1,7-dioic acid hydratase in catechol pathway
MKLVNYLQNGSTHVGVLTTDGIVKLGEDRPTPPSVLELLDAGDNGRDYVAKSVKSARSRIELAQVKLTAPVPNPRKFMAIGGNYRAHVAEIRAKMPNFVVPDNQVWFNKQVSCIIGPFDAIHKPKVSNALDYEAELAFVIAKRCRHVRPADAHRVIAGFMVCNDVSVRDWQMRSPTGTLGKSFDTHGPTGPWLSLDMPLEQTDDLGVKTYVNGELRQNGRTSDFIYSIRAMIEELSTVFTLEPGDIFATGTPPGVGAAMSPPNFLRAGDVVRIEIEALGAIENPVILEPDVA